MLLQWHIIFGAATLISFVKSETLSSENVGKLLLTYEIYINASLSLDRTDRVLLTTWSTEFQMKQVNITSKYRLDMTRHHERSFRGKKMNPKWKDCISLHEQQIHKAKSSYLESENECLRIANSADKKVQAVHQVEKEIRKWRKSYKYLSNICKRDNPDDHEAVSHCLVGYIKQDNYDVTLQRLIILKLEAMEHVLLEINRATRELEECLKTSLSHFLDSVRNVMNTLNICYQKTNREKEE